MFKYFRAFRLLQVIISEHVLNATFIDLYNFLEAYCKVSVCCSSF